MPQLPALLLRGARIVALDTPAPTEPVDVRIEAGRVAEIGPQLAASGVREIKADGAWLIPGLWDHHVHMAQWAQTRARLDLAGTASAQEVCRRVAAALRATDSPALVGFGYRPATWPQPPRVAELDAAGDGRPVVLISGDAHGGWLNSAALRFFGVAPREDPLDEAAWFAIWSRLGELPRDLGGEATAYGEAVRAAAALGVVGITDLEMARGWADWPERFSAGMDLLRVRAATYPDTLEEVIAAGLRTGDVLGGTGGQAAMGPLKVITDGSLNTRTAFCHTAYADAPAHYGTLNITGAALAELMTRASAHGLEVTAHAIGDAALTLALDAFTASGATGSIEHAQLVAFEDLPRMATLRLAACVQPAHAWDDRDVTQLVWPDRADRCFAFRTMADLGIRLRLSSDAPVSPLDPWLAMAAAVHRSGDEREPWNPAESLTAREALAASTNGVGTVDVGAVADLVLLDANPLAPQSGSRATAAHLRGIRPLLTVLGGRITHENL